MARQRAGWRNKSRGERLSSAWNALWWKPPRCAERILGNGIGELWAPQELGGEAKKKIKSKLQGRKV